jgi:hypothetical protein
MGSKLDHIRVLKSIPCKLEVRSFDKNRLYEKAVRYRKVGVFCRILPLSKENGSTDKKLMFGLYVEQKIWNQ